MFNPLRTLFTQLLPLESQSITFNTLDKKTISVFILLPLCLSMIHYVGQYSFLREGLLTIGVLSVVEALDALVNASASNNLNTLAYWVFTLFVFYVIVPVLTIRFLFREKVADYGLRFKGAFKELHLYVIMLLVMIPLVIYFSSTSSFQVRYPFFKTYHGNLLWSDLLIWEFFYILQFFALEFFFRGFVLFGLKPKLGIYSVFIMTIPYCMIHFGKPFPETLAAIIAGLVLGFLSFRSQSIWLGVLIHCSVGLGMDLAALWQKGQLNGLLP